MAHSRPQNRVGQRVGDQHAPATNGSAEPHPEALLPPELEPTSPSHVFPPVEQFPGQRPHARAPRRRAHRDPRPAPPKHHTHLRTPPHRYPQLPGCGTRAFPAPGLSPAPPPETARNLGLFRAASIPLGGKSLEAQRLLAETASLLHDRFTHGEGADLWSTLGSGRSQLSVVARGALLMAVHQNFHFTGNRPTRLPASASA